MTNDIKYKPMMYRYTCINELLYSNKHFVLEDLNNQYNNNKELMFVEFKIFDTSTSVTVTIHITNEHYKFIINELTTVLALQPTSLVHELKSFIDRYIKL